MHIYWYGLSSFKIVTKETTIFTDPFGKSAGLTPPRGGADIVISSDIDNELYNNTGSISGTPFLITGPGEYDVKGVFIKGISWGAAGGEGKINRKALYTISAEGMAVGFLGGFNESKLTDQQVEELNDINILLIPVGGKMTSDGEQAVEIVNQIEPELVIPMHYKTPGVALKIDGLSQFLKEMGTSGEETEKLLVKKNDLVEEKTRLVILKPQR